MGEKDRQNGLWPVERERSEEAKVLMNGLMSPSCHTGDLLASWPDSAKGHACVRDPVVAVVYVYVGGSCVDLCG